MSDLFAIRSGSDDDTDDRIYPALSGADEHYPFTLRSDDANIVHVMASGFALKLHSGGRSKELVSLDDHKIDVFLTDARVVLHCEKYDKGGGWTGFGGAGLAFAVVANGVSKARAAARRRGKALVGQIRYPWLSDVGASPKMGMLDSNQIRFITQDPDGDLLTLDVEFAKNVPVMQIAHDIAQRAARYRLSWQREWDDGEEAAFQALATTAPLAPVKKKFALYNMPSSWRIGSWTADVRQNVSGDDLTP